MSLSRRTFLGATAAVAGAWATGCRPDPEPPPPPVRPYVPGGTWQTVDPAAAGWDPARLEEALAFAGSRATMTLLLLLDGRILAERYYGVASSHVQEVASCQKSVVALLVGQAQDDGLLRIDDPVTTHLGAGWSNAAPADEQRITVRHLLTMTSGLDLELRPAAAPGTVWSYNNNAYHCLRLVLEAVTGEGIDPLCRRQLWDPIGATASTWYQRPGTGPDRLDPKGRRLWGLVMSARDLARFGLLVQRDGRWGPTCVVRDRAYLAAALASSTDLNPSYGYLWWLNGKASHRTGPQGRLGQGPLIPDAPADTVAALGRDDQKCYVSRSTGLVLVRQGERAGERSEALSSFDTELWARVLAAAP